MTNTSNETHIRCIDWLEIMTATEQIEFDELTDVSARAEWLLNKGVTAKLTVNPDTLAPAYHAMSAGVALPDYYDSEAEAIKKSTEWLQSLSNAKSIHPDETP